MASVPLWALVANVLADRIQMWSESVNVALLYWSSTFGDRCSAFKLFIFVSQDAQSQCFWQWHLLTFELLSISDFWVLDGLQTSTTASKDKTCIFFLQTPGTNRILACGHGKLTICGNATAGIDLLLFMSPCRSNKTSWFWSTMLLLELVLNAGAASQPPLCLLDVTYAFLEGMMATDRSRVSWSMPLLLFKWCI